MEHMGKALGTVTLWTEEAGQEGSLRPSASRSAFTPQAPRSLIRADKTFSNLLQRHVRGHKHSLAALG